MSKRTSARRAARLVKAGCGLVGQRETSAAAETGGLSPLRDISRKAYEPHLFHRRSEWGKLQPCGKDEKLCPSLSPPALQNKSPNLGPWERATMLSMVTGENSGEWLKKASGEDHSSLGKGRIRC